MLPSHLQELLTAAVDGELSSAEKRLVDKLLRDSEEARQFHGLLQADAERLRRLPAAEPTDDLSASVMNLIDERCLTPTPLPIQRRKGRWSAERSLPWISLATAAAVVVAVSLFTYAKFISKGNNPVVQKSDEKVGQPALPPVKDVNAPKQGALASSEQRRPAPGPVDPKELLPQPKESLAKNADTPPAVSPAPPRDPGIEKVVASAAEADTPRFQLYNVHLPLILPLRDLDDPHAKKRAREELGHNEAVRLDLFCKDSHRGAEVLMSLLKARGQQVLVDGLAHDHLKKKVRCEYAFFTESMSADDIAKLLEQLGSDDKKAETKKAGDGLFHKFVLAPLGTFDLAELAKLLGVSTAQLKLSRTKTSAPGKSLESMTANQVANKSASRGNEKLTLVLPFGVGNHVPQSSKEIKSFLDRRGERKSTAVPMMLVIRTLN